MDGGEKSQKQGTDYTTRKKTNLIQEEYPTCTCVHLFHFTIKCVEQMAFLVLG